MAFASQGTRVVVDPGSIIAGVDASGDVLPPLPNHTVLFQNERVRVSCFVLSPGLRHCIQLHHHYPTVRWQSEPRERSVSRVTLVVKRNVEADSESWIHLPEEDIADMEDWTRAVDLTDLESLSSAKKRKTSESAAEVGNGWEMTFSIPDRKVFFVPAATMLRIVTGAPGKEESAEEPSTFRQFVWEILQPPKYSPARVRELLCGCTKKNILADDGKTIQRCTTGVGTKLMFENDLCRVWDFYLLPGEGGTYDTVHHHTLPYVFVNTEASRLKGYSSRLAEIAAAKDPLPDSELKLLQIFDDSSSSGKVTWTNIPEDACLYHDKYAHGGKNGYQDKPMREYLVELC